MNTIKNNFLKFLKGFIFAFRGITYCVKHERNMRFHLGAAAAVVCFSFIAKISAEEKALIFICIGLVTALECFNTAVEKLCDKVTKGKENEYIRIAKDGCAGGVLAASAASLGVGCIIFIQKERLDRIFDFFGKSPVRIISLIFFILVWILWIFSCKKIKGFPEGEQHEQY